MGRLMIVISLVLMAAGIGFFVWVLQGPNNAAVQSFLSGLVCNDNETIVQWTGQYVGDGTSSTGLTINGREVGFYCEGLEGEQRSVTGQTALVIGGGFGVTLFISIIMLIWGISISTRNVNNIINPTRYITSGVASGIGGVTPLGTNTGYTSHNIPSNVNQQIDEVLNRAGFAAPPSGGTLADRLSQLEQARNQGLITESEFLSLRKSILDALDE
ncbi:MAG: hypothetical protein Kow00117_15110 [Phototrophicales bacterium]